MAGKQEKSGKHEGRRLDPVFLRISCFPARNSRFRGWRQFFALIRVGWTGFWAREGFGGLKMPRKGPGEPKNGLEMVQNGKNGLKMAPRGPNQPASHMQGWPTRIQPDIGGGRDGRAASPRAPGCFEDLIHPPREVVGVLGEKWRDGPAEGAEYPIFNDQYPMFKLEKSASRGRTT